MNAAKKPVKKPAKKSVKKPYTWKERVIQMTRIMEDDVGHVFLRAVIGGNSVRVLRDILENNKVNIEFADSLTGETPLYVAVKADNLEVVKFLLEKGADPFFKKSQSSDRSLVRIAREINANPLIIEALQKCQKELLAEAEAEAEADEDEDEEDAGDEEVEEVEQGQE